MYGSYINIYFVSTGYFRLFLIILGWFFFDRLYVFLPLYAVSAFLDGEIRYIIACVFAEHDYLAHNNIIV